ncbi:hypothetical protein CMV_010830, partial [Castanea mollissima]
QSPPPAPSLPFPSGTVSCSAENPPAKSLAN